MGNWTSRKSRSQKTGKGASWRTTDTFTYGGKGFTTSQSFGSKAGRTTFSSSANGSKVYNTVRNGNGMYMRTSKTISKTYKPKKIRFKKTKGKTDLGTLMFLIGFLFLLAVIFA